MPIEFVCSACNKPLRVADEVAGKIAKCPHCDAQMRVPISSEATNPSQDAGATQNPFAGPATVTREPAKSGGTITLRRIDVASSALMVGALYALFGLIGGLIFALFAVIGALAGGGPGGAQAIGGGLLIALFFPIANGVGGLVGGALLAVFYNLVAKFVGGIKFDI